MKKLTSKQKELLRKVIYDTIAGMELDNILNENLQLKINGIKVYITFEKFGIAPYDNEDCVVGNRGEII